MTTFQRLALAALAAAALLPSARAQAPAASAPAPHSWFHRYFAGTLGDKLAFTMDLKDVDGKLSGSYRYKGKGIDLYLNGKLDPAGTFAMEETPGDKPTGHFTGTLTATHLAGTWRSADGKRSLPFTADLTSEIHIGTKAEILADAVGDYPLHDIGGSGGANGMWDTWKEHGRWRSNSSGISNGMREASPVDLSRDDLKRLDGLHVLVTPDHGVHVMNGKRSLLDIPFKADAMPYALSKYPDNGVSLERYKAMSARTAVVDEALYLLVRDDTGLAAEMSGAYAEGIDDSVVVISYSLVGHAVSIDFVDGNCCGGTDFLFSRKP